MASCTVKCLFGMQSCEQPPAPPSPPRAPCQWASVCEAKLQSSPGDDLPVPYSRWLQAESTPLPRSPAPRHVRRRWLFLPAAAGQRHPQSPSQREDTVGVILCSPQIKSKLREKARPAIPGKLFVRSGIGMLGRPPGTMSVWPREKHSFQRQYLVCMGGRGGGGLVAEHTMQLCYFNQEIPFSPTHVHFAPTYYGLALSCLVIFEVARRKGLFWVRETEVISCHGRGWSVGPQAKGTTPLGM